MKLNISKWQKQWMGRKVEFTELFRRDIHGENYNLVTWIKVKLDCPIRGYAMGVRWLQSGVICHPSYYHSLFDESEYEPGGIRETSPRTLCYLVVPYPTRNPYKVPPESVILLEKE